MATPPVGNFTSLLAPENDIEDNRPENGTEPEMSRQADESSAASQAADSAFDLDQLQSALESSANELHQTPSSPSRLETLPPELNLNIATFAGADARRELRLVSTTMKAAADGAVTSYTLKDPSGIDTASNSFRAAHDISIEGDRFTDADMHRLLANLPAATTSLSFQGEGLSGSAFDNLPPQLKSLSITSQTMFSPGWGDWSQLQSLKLTGDSFIDGPLVHKDLKNTHTLLLCGRGFTDGALAGKDLKNVHTLALSSDRFTGLGLAGQNLPNLRTLILNGEGFADQALAGMDLKNVQSLQLIGHGFTDGALAGIDLKNVHTLQLHSSGFTSVGLAGKDLKNVRTLALHSFRGFPQTMLEGIELPKLRSGSLNGFPLQRLDSGTWTVSTGRRRR
jgi:hypothetical protein